MNRTTIKFPAEKARGKYFRDRTEFYAARIDKLALDEVKLEKHKLCNVLASVNSPLKETETAEERARKRKPPLHGFFRLDLPWLTLILGSGCSSESTEGAMWGSANSIADLLKDEENLPDKRRPDDVVRSFVQNLLKMRDPKIDEQSSLNLPNVGKKSDSAALLLFVTALLTQLYHEAAAAQVRPLDPKSRDRILFELGPQLRGEYIVRLVVPIKTYIRRLLKRGELSKAVNSTLSRVSAQLETQFEKDKKRYSGYIDQLELQILTEFSWLELTAWSTVYPGWSDLLADLVRQTESLSGDPPYGTPLRPTLSRKTLLDQISGTYWTVTQNSWRMREAEQKTNRHSFFDSAARVLMAQASVRSKVTPSESAPFACAFSTSFDLELEMALASRKDCTGFIIALPVYLQSYSGLTTGEDVDTAAFSWIGAVITRKAGATNFDLPDIQNPQNWISFSDPTVNQSDWKYANLPFVVHLAGSPLISLEGATKAFIDLAESGDTSYPGKQEPVIHALLLDEYDAMQQHSSEIFVPPPASETGSFSDQPFALPGFLMGHGGELVAQDRYWMVMGVQMDDAAVRHRVASRLGVASVNRLKKSQGDSSTKVPLSAGLVVVKKIGPAAQQLLQWFGVDFVESASGCSDFRDDLNHYAMHLEKEIKMVATQHGCNLPS